MKNKLKNLINLFSQRLKIPHLFIISVALISLMLLLIFTKGDRGSNNSLYYQNENDTKIEGPFELSNTTSRYALTEAIVKNGSFFLTQEQAKSSAPDVATYKGKFISIFTPGVSLLVIPLYFIGTWIGLPQIFAFLTIVMVALINIFLIAKIASKLGVGLYASILSGFTFAFSTNALGYTLTLTQHQISATIILLAILNSLQKRTIKNNILFGAIFGAGILMDIPNAILIAPVGLYILLKHIDLSKTKENLKVSLKLSWVGLIAGLLPFIVFFAFYNYSTTGSFSKVAQNIGRIEFFGAESIQNKPVTKEQINTNSKPLVLINLPFQTRSELNGFYILGLSNERSWLFYNPILLIGIVGLILLYRSEREKRGFLNVIISVVFLDFIIYSMFGDPWGGWAFGSRYLIPAAAVVAAAIGVVIQKFKKNPIFMALFFILFSYSVFISTLGALTTNAVAPKVEAVNLKPAIPYTYKYNLQFVKQNKSSNLIYNVYLYRYMSLSLFLYTLTGLIIFFASLIYLSTYKKRENR